MNNLSQGLMELYLEAFFESRDWWSWQDAMRGCIHRVCLWTGYVSAEKSCSVCSVCSFYERECKHTGFYCCRNQMMRKKLILFFKRRNHARKQRVSVFLFCAVSECMSLSAFWVSARPSGEVIEVTEKLEYLWEIKNRVNTQTCRCIFTPFCVNVLVDSAL